MVKQDKETSKQTKRKWITNISNVLDNAMGPNWSREVAILTHSVSPWSVSFEVVAKGHENHRSKDKKIRKTLNFGR